MAFFYINRQFVTVRVIVAGSLKHLEGQYVDKNVLLRTYSVVKNKSIKPCSSVCRNDYSKSS